MRDVVWLTHTVVRRSNKRPADVVLAYIHIRSLRRIGSKRGFKYRNRQATADKCRELEHELTAKTKRDKVSILRSQCLPGIGSCRKNGTAVVSETLGETFHGTCVVGCRVCRYAEKRERDNKHHRNLCRIFHGIFCF